MELNKAREICLGLMNSYGLGFWRFEFDNSVRRFGVCKYNTHNNSPGIIGLSKKLVLLNDEARVTDVILHEIAHALTRGHGHDDVWKAKCIEIGAKPIRCYTSKDTNTLELRYVAICGGCGKKHQKARMVNKNRMRSCNCQVGKDWSKRILLEYVDSKK